MTATKTTEAAECYHCGRRYADLTQLELARITKHGPCPSGEESTHGEAECSGPDVEDLPLPAGDYEYADSVAEDYQDIDPPEAP